MAAQLCGTRDYNGLCAEPATDSIILTCGNGHSRAVTICARHEMWLSVGGSHCSECVAERRSTRAVLVVSSRIDEDGCA